MLQVTVFDSSALRRRHRGPPVAIGSVPSVERRVYDGITVAGEHNHMSAQPMVKLTGVRKCGAHKRCWDGRRKSHAHTRTRCVPWTLKLGVGSLIRPHPPSGLSIVRPTRLPSPSSNFLGTRILFYLLFYFPPYLLNEAGNLLPR